MNLEPQNSFAAPHLAGQLNQQPSFQHMTGRFRAQLKPRLQIIHRSWPWWDRISRQLWVALQRYERGT